MTKAEFVAKVRENLTVDGARAGATTYVSNLIELGMIDLQHYIERYRVGHKDVYEASDFTTEEFASRGTLPAQCQIRDAYILRGRSGEITAVDATDDEITVADHELVTPETEDQVVTGFLVNSGGTMLGGVTENRAYFLRPIGTDGISLYVTKEHALNDDNRVDITSEGTGTNTLKYSRQRHGCVDIGWGNRYQMISGQICVGDMNGRICVDPNGSTFYVFPEIVEEDMDGFSYSFELNWDGKKLEWQDGDEVPFILPDTLTVAAFVKSHVEREVNRDLQMAASYAGTHAKGRRDSYLDSNARGRSR